MSFEERSRWPESSQVHTPSLRVDPNLLRASGTLDPLEGMLKVLAERIHTLQSGPCNAYFVRDTARAIGLEVLRVGCRALHASRQALRAVNTHNPAHVEVTPSDEQTHAKMYEHLVQVRRWGGDTPAGRATPADFTMTIAELRAHAEWCIARDLNPADFLETARAFESAQHWLDVLIVLFEELPQSDRVKAFNLACTAIARMLGA